MLNHLNVILMLVAFPQTCATGILVDLSFEFHVQAKSNAPFPFALYGVLQLVNFPRSLAVMA